MQQYNKQMREIIFITSNYFLYFLSFVFFCIHFLEINVTLHIKWDLRKDSYKQYALNHRNRCGEIVVLIVVVVASVLLLY